MLDHLREYAITARNLQAKLISERVDEIDYYAMSLLNPIRV